MDTLTRRSRRRGGNASDDDSDDGPPPDPDEPAPAPAPRKQKKTSEDAKEVQVAVRKSTDDRGVPFGGGLTAVRREMLMAIRAEEDERWEDYEYCDAEVRCIYYNDTVLFTNVIRRLLRVTKRLRPCSFTTMTS